MTDRATLEALLARVLEGDKPDRELDAEIWIASERGASDLAAPPWRYLGGGCWNDDSEPYGHNKVYAPPYTASLEAALTLVPEGWYWSVSGVVNKEYHARIVPPTVSRKTFMGYWSEAKTAPRALIAACLKARMEAQPLSNP